MRTLLTVENGYLGLEFGDRSQYQGTHKGWDVWPATQRSRAQLILNTRAKVVEIRDFGSVRGFKQAIQLRFENGYVLQAGHLLAGISRRYKVGDWIEAGEPFAEVGTHDDGLGVRHAHLELFDDLGAALRYEHHRALDPMKYRHLIKDTGPVLRVAGFSEDALADFVAGANESVVRGGLSLVDIPCGAGGAGEAAAALERGGRG